MVSDRIGQRPVMVVGLVLQGVGLAWFAAVATSEASYAQLILPLLVAGIGVSMPFATTATAALSAVTPADMGKASGAANTLRQFGAAFGIAIATAIFAANGHLGSAAAFAAGFRPALGVAAAISLLGAITALAVSGHRTSRVAAQARRPITAVANPEVP
jgi:MFS family permease